MKYILLISLLFVAYSSAASVNVTDIFGQYYYMTVYGGHNETIYYAYAKDTTSTAQMAYRKIVSPSDKPSTFTTTFVYFEQTTKKFVYEQYDSSPAQYSKFKSSKFIMMPWDYCTSKYDLQIGFQTSKLNIALQTATFQSYMNTNSQVYSAPNCQFEDYNVKFTNYFVFGTKTDNSFNEPYFWTNNFTSVTINQYNRYGSYQALVSDVGDIFQKFYSKATPPTAIKVPSLMASAASTVYGPVPSEVTNFPFGWVKVFNSASKYFVDEYVTRAATAGSRFLFVDGSQTGFGKYVCSVAQAAGTAPPFPINQFRTSFAANIEGYTIVQINQWYTGTQTELNNMPALCGTGNTALATAAYIGCQRDASNLPVLGVNIDFSIPTCAWAAGQSDSIDTFINISFQDFYQLNRPGNNN